MKFDEKNPYNISLAYVLDEKTKCSQFLSLPTSSLPISPIILSLQRHQLPKK
jgi:hypothetical protein